MVSSYMRSKANTQQLVVGLGAAGAVAVVAAAAVAYAVASRRRRCAYSKQEWAEALQEIGTIRGFDEIVEEVAKRSIEPSIRPDVWPFLLEVFDYASTYRQRQQQHQLMVRQYQQLLLQCQAYEAAWKESLRPSSPSPAAAAAAPAGTAQQQQQQLKSSPQYQPQQQQLQLPEQVRQFAEAHRIIVVDAVRMDFQKHSAAVEAMHNEGSYFSSVRSSNADSGPGSSGAGGYNSSFVSNSGMAAVASLVNQGLSTLQQYWLGSLLGGQAAAWGHHQKLWVSEAAQLVLDSSNHMAEESKRQAARMIAMLSAYALHDPDTGYCQGMSDLLLPLLLLMEDDALAFWCFVAFMQQQGARKNFAVDESGIFAQLKSLEQVLDKSDKPLMFRLHQLGAAECHFAYRMMVVMMRRDMPLHKVLLLWEVLWADAWKQRQLARAAAKQQAAEALQDSNKAAVGNALATASISPSSTGKSAAVKSSKEAAAAGGPVVLMADSRSSSKCGDREQAQQDSSSSRGPDLFTCFLAAVIISQRRQVLDHCHDADDVLRLFQSLKQVDVWDCLQKAWELRKWMTMHEEGQRQ